MAYKCPHCRKSVNDGMPIHTCIEGDKAIADNLRKMWGTNTEGTRVEEPLTMDKIMAALDAIPKVPQYEGELPFAFEIQGVRVMISLYMPDNIAMVSEKVARTILFGLGYEGPPEE